MIVLICGCPKNECKKTQKCKEIEKRFDELLFSVPFSKKKKHRKEINK